MTCLIVRTCVLIIFFIVSICQVPAVPVVLDGVHTAVCGSVQYLWKVTYVLEVV